MNVPKRQCKPIAVRPQPNIYKELEKEASEKGLTVANYCEKIINNRHNLITPEESDCVYKATIEQYYVSSVWSIEDIKEYVAYTKENIFDGEDGYIDCKLISIEKLEW